MSGSNRTNFELTQRIAALPPVVRAQLTEILAEMMNGSTQRAFATAALSTGAISGTTLNATGQATFGAADTGADVTLYGNGAGSGYVSWSAALSTLYVPGMNFVPQSLTGDGAIVAKATLVTLNKAAGLAATIAAPAAGRFLIIAQIGAGTHTVTLTAGTWEGTNDVANFNADGDALVVVGISATRFIVLSNAGSVTFN